MKILKHVWYVAWLCIILSITLGIMDASEYTDYSLVISLILFVYFSLVLRFLSLGYVTDAVNVALAGDVSRIKKALNLMDEEELKDSFNKLEEIQSKRVAGYWYSAATNTIGWFLSALSILENI